MAKEQFKTVSELDDDNLVAGNDDDELCPGCGIELESGTCPDCGYVPGEIEKSFEDEGFSVKEKEY